MRKHTNKLFLLTSSVFLLSNIVGCSGFHVEIPITTITETKEDSESLESEVNEINLDESDDIIQQIIEQSSSEDLNNTNIEEITSEEEIKMVSSEPIGSFQIIDDAIICKNLNFDMSNKLVSVYDVEGNSVVASSVAVDRTKKEECVLKYKIKDSNVDVWVYTNSSGVDKNKLWEPVVVTNSLIANYGYTHEGFIGSDYTGNYLQLDEVKTDEAGVVTHTVYNDTYVTKIMNNVLISLHLSTIKNFSDENYTPTRLISDAEIRKVLDSFSYVDSKEVQVIEKTFNFENTLIFSQHVINSNIVSDLPYSVSERVVAGGETISAVEVVDNPGLKLQVKNPDTISKSIKQCQIVSLTYDFLESSEYDCMLFDYLVPNSHLEDVDTIILKYDNYYIDSNGTGYVTYNLDKDCIKSVTTYYIQNRLAGLVVDFN